MVDGHGDVVEEVEEVGNYVGTGSCFCESNGLRCLFYQYYVVSTHREA